MHLSCTFHGHPAGFLVTLGGSARFVFLPLPGMKSGANGAHVLSSAYLRPVSSVAACERRWLG